MRFLRGLRHLFILVFDFIARQGIAKGVKSDLILVRVDSIGDFIIWLDSAKEYKRIYPNRRIVLVANSQWASMASYFPYWDEILPVNINLFNASLAYRYDLIRKVRRENFEIAIHPAYSRALFNGDSIIRASQALKRIGSVGDYQSICNH